MINFDKVKTYSVKYTEIGGFKFKTLELIATLRQLCFKRDLDEIKYPKVLCNLVSMGLVNTDNLCYRPVNKEELKALLKVLESEVKCG